PRPSARFPYTTLFRSGFQRQVFGLRAAGGLVGADVFLDEPSVTATENAVMAASLARGTTRIRNAAAEPHVQDLCHMLAGMGCEIDRKSTRLNSSHVKI